MAVATDQQVQTFVDDRIRPRAEQSRSVLLSMEDDLSAIGDVYEALTQPSPTWTDTRTDGPPHLLVPSDVLAINTFMTQLVAIIRGTLANDAAKIAACNDVAAQLPIVLKACVRAV